MKAYLVADLGKFLQIVLNFGKNSFQLSNVYQYVTPSSSSKINTNMCNNYRLNEVKGGPKFMKFFGTLAKDDKFYKEIDNILELIKENPQIGDRIQYEKIPKCYITAYNAPNLFRVQLNNGWRLVYSLIGKQNQKTVYMRYLIIKIMRWGLDVEIILAWLILFPAFRTVDHVQISRK